MNKEWKSLLIVIIVFLIIFYLPLDSLIFRNALMESLALVKWYAREHVVLCLIPAFFIAGAIAVFVKKESVMKYLGANAPKVLAYGVASVSGTILAVCSCTVLPLFAGIYKMGAGLGPATTFLYSGPAINVLAIVLTAAVLGPELGIARAVGAIGFSIVIGLLMHLIFYKEEKKRQAIHGMISGTEVKRPLWQNALYFASMVGILVFANWSRPQTQEGVWSVIYNFKWIITSLFALGFAVILVLWFKLPLFKVSIAAVSVVLLAFLFKRHPMVPFAAGFIMLAALTAPREDDTGEWFRQSWGFAKQILPLLFLGVLIAGLLLGRPGREGLIPPGWISSVVGGNSLWANFFASFAGAFMYFATLTEVPILQGLLGSGMGKGPALALLLAGPALSLPNMLVIRSVMGTRKTAVFVFLVIIMATFTGMLYGSIFG